VAGVHIFDIDLPRVVPNPNTPALMPRFLRLNYIVATGPMTAGGHAELVLGRDDQCSTSRRRGRELANAINARNAPGASSGRFHKESE
jgi:hypothetical protein